MSPHDAAPAIPPDVLVEHAQFVRRVAWAILRDDADADDAAQETLARGLVAGPGEPRARSSWLATVARNVARRLRRGDARAAARDERAARPEATSSSLDHAVRAETIRAVAEAVVALDEPMRAAVIWRHYDGLPPREIATRTGESVETVKKRLSRAHARLRERLEEQRPGGGARWRSALAGFAGIPLDGGAAGSAGTSSATTTVAGGLAMGTTAKLALGVAVAALLGVGGWWWLSRDGDEKPAASPTPPSLAASDAPPAKAPPMLAAQGERRPGAEASSANAAPAAVASSVASPAAEPTNEQARALAAETADDVLEGVVLGTSGPVPGIWVSARVERITAVRSAEIARRGVPMSDVANAAARTDESGQFHLANMLGDDYTLFVDDGGRGGITRRALQSAIGPGGKRTRTVIVLGDGVVEGTVFDRAGAPAPKRLVRLSRVLVFPAQQWRRGETLETTTGADGNFRLTRVPSSNWTLSATLEAPDGASPDQRERHVHTAPGETVRADLGSSTPDRLWTGTVRVSTGTAIRGPAEFRMVERASNMSVAVRVGEEGRVSQRLPAGSYEVQVFDGRRVTVPPIEVAEAELERDVVLPGVLVSGVIRDLAASPTADAARGPQFRVFATSVGDMPAPAAPTLPAPGAPPAPPMAPGTPAHLPSEFTLTAVVRSDGSFQFVGISPGRWRLTVATREGNRVPVTSEIQVTDQDATGIVFEMRKP